MDPALQREFWSALASGDAARMEELVRAGANVNVPIGGPNSETPLIRAVTAGDLDLARTLLELGADPNLASKGPRMWTPLMFAHDNAAMLRELTAAGANVNARSSAYWIKLPSGGMKQLPGGETALHLAAAAGKANAVRALLQAGANPEAVTADGCGPLDYALRLGTATDAAAALVEAGAQLTPQRLEAMHASAHRPDSDLLAFPFSSSAGVQPGRAQAAVSQPMQARPTPKDLRCPKCHALIYSRKPRICGQCGALLPPDLLLTEQESRAQTAARQWARDLADKMSTRLSSAGKAFPAIHPPVERSQPENRSPEELLRQVSCVEEFRHRERPAFWLYVVGYGLMLALAGFLHFKLRLLPPGALLVMLGLMATHCCRAWQIASPICPNCRQNIRACPSAFCHRCGRPLNHQRCLDCGVDDSWIGFLRPRASGGSFRWIKFCPGCGVRLDSWVRRWRAG